MTARRRFYAVAVAALASALLAAALAVMSPASAEPGTEMERARAQLADCEAMRAGATTSRQRAWGNDCVAMARAWVERLSASPSPTASTPAPSPTTPSPTPTPTASPTPSPTVSPTPTSPPSPVGCALPLYPTPACTGTPEGWTPTRTVSGDYTARAGEVIDGWRITGSLWIRGANVTVRNSEVYTRIYNQASGLAYNGLVIEDTTIGPPSGNSGATTGAIGVCGYTARRVEIRNSPEGFRVGGYGYSGGDCGPVEIVDSFGKLANVGCDHSDGVQEYDWRPNSTVIAHTTIDMRGVSCATSPLYIGYGGVVKDNLLMGGAYVLRIYQWHSQATYTQVSGNRIVASSWDGGTGPTLVETCSIIASWRDNRLATIDSAYRVTAGSLLTRCPESTASLGHVFP